jgi:hypothetical protein
VRLFAQTATEKEPTGVWQRAKVKKHPEPKQTKHTTPFPGFLPPPHLYWSGRPAN